MQSVHLSQNLKPASRLLIQVGTEEKDIDVVKVHASNQSLGI